uniref:Cadherin domain-containing protein n=1 Tax=Macrostomum lignano TaxID=282301 RepID=A0A1I8JQN3_9PLAT
HLIGKLNATDADEGPNARLHYRLATPPQPRSPRPPPAVPGATRTAESSCRPAGPRNQSPLRVRRSGLRLAAAPDPGEERHHHRPHQPGRRERLPAAVPVPLAGNRTLVVPDRCAAVRPARTAGGRGPGCDGNGRMFFFIRAASASSTPPYESSAGPFHIDPDSGIVSLSGTAATPPLESSQTLRIVFRQSSRRPGGDLMDDGGFNAGSLSGSGGGGDGSEDGGRVVVSGDGTDSMVLIAGSLIAVTVIFVLLLLVAFALLSCRRHGRGRRAAELLRSCRVYKTGGLVYRSSAGQIADLPAPPAGVADAARVAASRARTFLQRGGVGARRGSGSGNVCFTEEESGQAMAVQRLSPGSRGFYKDSLAVQRQQQTRRAVGGQQPALEHSASSSLAQAEEEGHSRSSCEEAGGVAATPACPEKSSRRTPTGNNYESLLLLRAEKLPTGTRNQAELATHTGLEIPQMHYSTVPHQASSIRLLPGPHPQI